MRSAARGNTDVACLLLADVVDDPLVGPIAAAPKVPRVQNELASVACIGSKSIKFTRQYRFDLAPYRDEQDSLGQKILDGKNGNQGQFVQYHGSHDTIEDGLEEHATSLKGWLKHKDQVDTIDDVARQEEDDDEWQDQWCDTCVRQTDQHNEDLCREALAVVVAAWIPRGGLLCLGLGKELPLDLVQNQRHQARQVAGMRPEGLQHDIVDEECAGLRDSLAQKREDRKGGRDDITDGVEGTSSDQRDEEHVDDLKPVVLGHHGEVDLADRWEALCGRECRQDSRKQRHEDEQGQRGQEALQKGLEHGVGIDDRLEEGQAR
eukprot:m.111957 g.111957  ORF g.111957 m.111957 type:complete len:320 (+) comp9099_c0_seq7:335-1294(+)